MSKDVLFEGTHYTVPDDASMDEIDQFIQSQKAPKPLTTVQKVRNFLGTGDVTKPPNVEEMSRGPNLPPAVSHTMTALSLVDPAVAIAENPAGVINLGRSLYSAARAGFPKIAGGAALAGAGGGMEAATEGFTGLPHYARYLASYPGIRMAMGGLKDAGKAFASEFNPARMGELLSSESTRIGKVAAPPSNIDYTMGTGELSIPGVGTKPPSPPPDLPVGLVRSAEAFPEGGSGQVAKQLRKFTPGKVTYGPSYAPADVTIKTGESLFPETSNIPEWLTKSAKDFEGGKVKKQLMKFTPGKESYGTPRRVTPVRKTTIDVSSSVGEGGEGGGSIVSPPEVPPKTSPLSGPSAFMDTESSGLQIPQETSARGAVASKLAKSMHANKITVDQIEALGPKDAEHFWRTLGRIHKEGYIPSELTKEQTLRQLNMLESVAQRGRYSGLGTGAPGQE